MKYTEIQKEVKKTGLLREGSKDFVCVCELLYRLSIHGLDIMRPLFEKI